MDISQTSEDDAIQFTLDTESTPVSKYFTLQQYLPIKLRVDTSSYGQLSLHNLYTKGKLTSIMSFGH